MRTERIVLGIVLATFVALTVSAIATHAPFEYDEAVYAGKARAWAGGPPASAWAPHRAPLLPAVGSLVSRAGARSEWPFRAVGVASGCALLLAAWMLARSLHGVRAGLIAAGVLATAYTLVSRSAQFLTDVPAAAALLGAVIVLRRHKPGEILVAAPLLAAAFFLRYGSAVPIAAVCIVAILMWPRDRHLAATFGLLFLLLVPHVVYAMRTFGTPWGALTYTSRVAGRAYVGDGLWDYLRGVPFTLAGPVAGLAIIAGLIAAVRDRLARPLVAIAFAHIVVIGLVDHGEPRFIFFPVALLVVAGSGVIARASTSRTRTLVLIVAFVASAAGAGGIVVERTEHSRRARAKVAAEGRAMRAAHTCAPVAAQAAIVGWYSQCFVLPPNAPRSIR